MTDLSVDRLRAAFGLTDELMVAREQIAAYAHSFVTIMVDTFYDEHLEPDPYFHRYLVGLDSARLRASLRGVLIDLFVSPFDDALIERLRRVGAAHRWMHLLPLHLVRAFGILQEIVADLSLVNREVRTAAHPLLRLLKVAEYVVVSANAIEDARRQVDDPGKGRVAEVFELLFQAHDLHRASLERLEALWSHAPADHAGPRPDELPPRAGDAAAVDRVLEQLAGAAASGPSLRFDAVAGQALNRTFQAAAERFTGLLAAGAPESELRTAMSDARRSSDALLSAVGRPLQDVAAVSFLAVNSGFRFVQALAQTLYDNQHARGQAASLADTVERDVAALVRSTLGWSIDALVVSRTGLAAGDYDVATAIPMRHAHLHVGIRLKDLPNRAWLHELMTVMLEIIRVSVLGKEREGALIELADVAERANRSKDVFLANMSHELRTPLNAIIGFSQILAGRSELPDTLRPHLERIRLAGDNLLHLVNTILDFAKLEAGRIVFEPRRVATGHVLREAAVLVEPMARTKAIRFEWPADPGDVVEMDPQLIKQVLLNLLSNAFKFTPHGGAVRVTCGLAADPAMYEFAVHDTGVGIAAEDLGSLFKPFHQLDSPLRKSAQGTGLGLTITRRIVEELHGGRVVVKSALGEGSTFSAQIPVRRPGSFVRRVASTGAAAGRLLVVEEHEHHVGVLVAALAPRFDLVLTNSVARAKALLAEERFDHHVFDYFLVDGVSADILLHMEKLGVPGPVFIVSAESDRDLVSHVVQNPLVQGVFGKSDARAIGEALLRHAAGEGARP